MELPEPDPTKLLQSWMEWERGEVTPGRVMANLKTGGLRQLLEGLAAQRQAASRDEGAGMAGETTEQQGSETASWTPVV
jgi:hypothetical protein